MAVDREFADARAAFGPSRLARRRRSVPIGALVGLVAGLTLLIISGALLSGAVTFASVIVLFASAVVLVIRGLDRLTELED